MDIILGSRRRRRPIHPARRRSSPQSYPRRFPCQSSGKVRRLFSGTRALTGDAATPKNVSPVDLPWWKRGFDLMLVILALPLVLALAGLLSCWIRLVSPGPVLFKQTRIGKGGKPFTIYKFRSMHASAATSHHEAHVEDLIRTNRPMTKLDWLGDPRLIRGGCLLRMLGLDELPQLLNVLRGEMSLVGPRPCLPNEFDCFATTDLTRFAVEPGLTGIWQIRRTNCTTFREMLAMDESYVAGRNLLADLGIIALTPVALVSQSRTCFESRSRANGTRHRTAAGGGGGATGSCHAVGAALNEPRKTQLLR